MKKYCFWIGIVCLVILLLIGYFNVTGNVVGGSKGMIEGGYGGPSAEDSACLKKCVVDEGKEEGICMNECGVEPEPINVDEDESCMQKCIKIGCEEYDINCQNKKMNDCEDECGMKGDAPDESEMGAEQLCISNCVAAEDPSVICGNSQSGEIGNALCQKCAANCVHLYEGPCLNDEELTEKEEACKTCEHCYGGPVEGASGQGWDCIIDVECKDASAEFGDEAGEGPGIGQEGYVATNFVAGAVDGGIKFFKGLFG
jgi:hypothetical protein